MCGIAGIISLNNRPILRIHERSKKMMHMLDHYQDPKTDIAENLISQKEVIGLTLLYQNGF